MWEALIKDIGSKFELHAAPPQEAQYTFTAEELLEEKGMRTFIDCYGTLIKALDQQATAAYFGGWFASVALAVQYSLSAYSAVPEITLPRLRIHLVPVGPYCRVAFTLTEWSMNTAPEDEEARQSWREQVFRDFYADTAAPLIASMSAVSGMPAGEIWGQLPTKFNYYVDLLTGGGIHAGMPDTDAGSRLAARVLEDYSALKLMPSDAAFTLRRNPFQVPVRKTSSLEDPGKSINLRNRCCQYFRTEGGSYCFNCPRLKESEREARRAEYRKTAAGQV